MYSEPPVKRKRGRPRKAHVTPQFTEEELTQGRVTRRGAKQPQDEPAVEEQKEMNNPLVDEILDNLQYAQTAQHILKVEPLIGREKLERLKQIYSEDPRTLNDICALRSHLDGDSDDRLHVANKKRKADSTFGARSQNAQAVKKIKREDSPESMASDITRMQSKIYSSPVFSPALLGAQSRERNEYTGAARSILASQQQDAPAGRRRQIIQDAGCGLIGL